MTDQTSDAIEAFAAHVADTPDDAIPPAARAAAKTFILDSLGVGVAGSAGPAVEELIACSADWGRGDDAGVWVDDRRLPAPSAAMVNAYQVHNSEFDAVHEGAVLHPMASILGAVLAHGERRGGLNGRQLLSAAVLGADVSCSIGVGATTGLTFFRPATAGAFGAAAALGRADGVSAGRLVDACGLLLGQISGTMQAHAEVSALLGMQLGFCTRAAVMAHDMAARGLTGPRRVLEGPYGYYALFEGGHEVNRVVADLGRVWRIAEVSHKPVPGGRATHGAVEGLLTLMDREGFDGEAVDSVEVEVTPLVHRLCGRPDIDDPTPNYALLCIPYGGAVALLRGAVTVEDFRPPRLADAVVHDLARRIRVVPRDDPDPNALDPTTVSVRLRDGQNHTVTLDKVLGNPAKPLSRDQHLEKFRRNWRSGVRPLSEADGERLIALVDHLEEVADVSEIIGLLRL